MNPANQNKIAVIIRVYSRIYDTEALIHIIKNNWKSFDYELFVVHNGENGGFKATQLIKNQKHYIRVENNPGHRLGARELVKAGLLEVSKQPELTKYIFIESDFWLLDDNLVKFAVNKMKATNKPCASYIWVPKRCSYAVDFFIVDSEYAKSHPKIFEWDDHPERYFSRVAKKDVCLLPHMGAVHAASILSLLKISSLVLSKCRFRIFPEVF